MLSLHKIPFQAMGTDCAIRIYATSEGAAERLAQFAIAEVYRIESRYSRYRADSGLSRINDVAGHGGSIFVDDETASLLDYAFTAYRFSDGLFDITSGVLRKAWKFRSGPVPDQKVLESLLHRIGLDKVIWNTPRLTFTVAGMELDFGGLAKEYAVDRAAEIGKAYESEHAVIDLGGDLRIVGPHPRGEPWQIGIRHPRLRGEIMAIASLTNGSLATSGDYERCIELGGKRYSHILNPRSGWPSEGLRHYHLNPRLPINTTTDRSWT